MLEFALVNYGMPKESKQSTFIGIYSLHSIVLVWKYLLNLHNSDTWASGFTKSHKVHL